MPRQLPIRIRQVQLRLTPAEHEAVRAAAADEVETVSQWIRAAIRQQLKNQGVSLAKPECAA